MTKAVNLVAMKVDLKDEQKAGHLERRLADTMAVWLAMKTVDGLAH